MLSAPHRTGRQMAQELEISEVLTGRVIPRGELPPCEVCRQVKDDVQVCIDPYRADVWNEQVKARLCGDCYQNKLDDV
jgi:hypothetical protein